MNAVRGGSRARPSQRRCREGAPAPREKMSPPGGPVNGDRRMKLHREILNTDFAERPKVAATATATATETDEYLIARFPDSFDHPLEVVRFTPAGPVADAVEMVLGRARVYGLPKLWWMVRLDSPPGWGNCWRPGRDRGRDPGRAGQGPERRRAGTAAAGRQGGAALGGRSGDDAGRAGRRG